MKGKLGYKLWKIVPVIGIEDTIISHLVGLDIPWERLSCWSSSKIVIANIFLSQGEQR